MVLVDTNIFIYTAGSEHPNKAPSAALLNLVAAGEIAAAVSTELLQEILYRYRSQNRWQEGAAVYRLVRKIVPHVFPLTPEIMDHALELLERYPSLYARDAVHAATCFAMKVSDIVSYDTDFDCVEGLTRLTPDHYVAGGRYVRGGRSPGGVSFPES